MAEGDDGDARPEERDRDHEPDGDPAAGHVGRSPPIMGQLYGSGPTQKCSRFNELSPGARPEAGQVGMMDVVIPVTTTAPRVLIVEDDPNVAEVVARYLQREGYRVEIVSDGALGLERALSDPPDLLVLDLMLPTLGGLEVCRQLRAVVPVPIIMLTARGEEADRITGLELGADDYVAKPFSPRELTARVKAVLRRAGGTVAGAQQEEPTVLEAGSLRMDLVGHEAHVDGQLVALTAREFDLLAHLMSNPRRAFRREQLLEDVWGFAYGDTSTVTVHIRRLREKVEADPSAPRHVCTVWGVGYRFEP
jgi:DNA-binding response OmpR family regulator